MNGWKTVRLIRQALASSRWRFEDLRQLQEEQLRNLLMHAYQNVPLYRGLYKDAGYHPDEFRSLDDIDKIPILQKDRLKQASPEEVVVQGIDPHRCGVVETSGSTGTPLRIFLGALDQQWQRVVAWRILFEHGFRWTDRTLEIRMTFGRQFFVQRLGIAPKEWCSILDTPEFWAQRIVETRPDVIVAGAGTLHALADTVKTLGLNLPSPRLIVSDSETLSPATRQLVRGALGRDPVDVYGLVELSNFAWECERRSGFHVSADSHIVEVPADSGEPGPIITTALGMWTMPMIRYETGDLAEVETTLCPCGRTLPLLRQIYGRRVDSVALQDGRRIFWPFFHEVLGRYDELRQWRILQEEINEVHLQLVVTNSAQGLLPRIKSDLQAVLPGEIHLRVEQVEAITLAPGEKTRMIISKVGTAIEPHPVSGREGL
ncbi:phenylacetate--CoA ligase family protein [Nitrospira sp. T9]|uniref:phenylacetate--CoA ligase family protein n=1 Tax=Nitrospira sp. T9 TaxID=3456077 RepID=UPI003F9B6996